jgi:hypothetical protein
VIRRADEAGRARLILLLDSGQPWASIRDKLECTNSFIDRWSKRFAEERLAGRLPTTLTPALEARILEWSVKRNPRRWLDALEHAQARCLPGHNGEPLAHRSTVSPALPITSACVWLVADVYSSSDSLSDLPPLHSLFALAQT